MTVEGLTVREVGIGLASIGRGIVPALRIRSHSQTAMDLPANHSELTSSQRVLPACQDLLNIKR